MNTSYAFKVQPPKDTTELSDVSEEDEDTEPSINNQDTDLSFLRNVRQNFENTDLKNIPYKKYPYFSTESPQPLDIKQALHTNPLGWGLFLVFGIIISIAIFNKIWAFGSKETFDRIRYYGMDHRPIVSWIVGPILIYFIITIVF